VDGYHVPLNHDLAFKHRAMGERDHWRVTEDVATSWNHGAFYAGKVALLLADDGRIKPAHQRAEAAGFHLDLAPLPRRKRKVAGFENTVFQIWKSSDPARTETAWKFAQSYLPRENQVRTMIEEGLPLARRDVHDDLAALKFQQQWPDARLFLDRCKTCLRAIRSWRPRDALAATIWLDAESCDKRPSACTRDDPQVASVGARLAVPARRWT